MRGPKDEHWYDTMLTMDLSKKTLKWKVVEQPFKRHAFMAASFEGELNLVRGFSEDNKVMKNLTIYDPKTREWSEGPELPRGFSVHCRFR